MRNWKSIAHRIVSRMERGVDQRLRTRRSDDGLVEIHPFRGYGTRDRLHVVGRVLWQPRIVAATDEGSVWENVLETFRRMSSAEVAGAEVEALFAGVRTKAATDDEGYFHFVIGIPGGLPDQVDRIEVTLRVTGPKSRRDAVAEVIVPPPSARFGIISDIDDTIVETNATSLVRMARTVFTQNARGRIVMEGVADFYRQLQSGASGEDRNPIFYVSSSPWNFYDLIDQFLAINGIPAGPLMLQDYGVDEQKLVHAPHEDHKLEQIEEIFRTYPEMPFVLIGDSGQRDPEIYRQVALDFGSRILTIYIRDVTTADRDAEVKRIAAELLERGVPIALIGKTSDAAAHAKGLGLIR